MDNINSQVSNTQDYDLADGLCTHRTLIYHQADDSGK